MNLKLKPIKTVIATSVIAIIAVLIILKFSQFGWLLAGVIFLLGAGELAIIYFLKREIFKREQNIFVQISIALLGITLVTAVVDIVYGSGSMPGWTALLGLLLMFSGNYLMMTALFAVPRHGKQEYGEEEKAEKTMLSVHGPYDVIRHPINLAGFLLAVSIPLMLGSALAFIPAVLAVISIITHAVIVENYRFEHYTWYYDYTKKVPYMVFPVIW